jgi:hypothetical protein
MLGIASSWAFLFEHPVVGLIVFVAVTLGAIVVLSGGNLGGSLAGMLRVAFSFLTAPFIYLRDALTGMRNSGEEEQNYKRSRVFMMFRWSKLLYLGLLVYCLLQLSSGITSSLVSLYPRMEIEQGRMLDEQIAGLESQITTANQTVTAAGAPEFRQQLETQRNEARTAYQQQLQSNMALVQGTTFTGPLISQLANAGSARSVANVRDNIDTYYMSSCPRGYNWRGMTAETCAQYRAFAFELAAARLREFELQDAAQAAETAYIDADSAAQNAAAQLAALQAQLQATQEQRASVSLFDPEMWTQRIVAAVLGILMTLLGVIISVWVGASVISLFSWLVLMMRGLEILLSQKVKEAPPPEEEEQTA